MNFFNIGLMGRQRREPIGDTLLRLEKFLLSCNRKVWVEQDTAQYFPSKTSSLICPREALGSLCDLIIVIGGDGSLLQAARAVVDDQKPLLGINRGHLGFLTDVSPQELEEKVAAILKGDYSEEQRFLLSTSIHHHDEPLEKNIALNEAVLLPGHVVRMIEFSIDIDQQFVCSQRADGLIVATPTGSTAYALSGGGPILHPQLEAVVLVPIFSHTLTARPIVVHADSEISIHISENNEVAPSLSCDGQAPVVVPIGSRVQIRKKKEQLRLIHPREYNYFSSLRTKLHWHAN